MPGVGPGSALRTDARRALVLAVATVACACTVPHRAPGSLPPLRVGVAADVPPLVFQDDGRLTGLEVELAGRLASDLQRALRLVALPRAELVPALFDGRVDVVMSAPTAAALPSDQLLLGTPYLRSGVTGLVRRRDAARYHTTAAVLRAAEGVGVTIGSRGESYARETLEDCTVTVYRSPDAALAELRQGAIDVLLDDAPLVRWLAARSGDEFVDLGDTVADDARAWGFRRTDVALHGAADAALARWAQDGSLAAAVRRWLPDGRAH